MSKKKQKHYAIFSISVLTIGLTIIVFMANGFLNPNCKLEPSYLGTFGDFIGGFLGTVLTIIATVYVYKTYHSQKKELKLQRQLITQQQFESTFFNMLNVHRELKNDLLLNANMSLSFAHDGSLEELFKKNDKDALDLILIQEKLNEGKKSGANVFEIISNDYKLLFYDSKNLNKQIQIFKNDRPILFNKLNKILKELEDFNKEYEKFYKRFYKENDIDLIFCNVNDFDEIDVNKFSKEDVLEYLMLNEKFINKTFELLFDKHQYIISHYCRNVFHILKFIRKNEIDESINTKNKLKLNQIKEKYKNYANIFQSQLNVDEQFLLFYNFIHFDKETEDKTFWTINLVNHYKFLENIGVKNLIYNKHELFYNFLIKGSNRKIEN